MAACILATPYLALQRPLYAGEVLQVVDVDGMPGRHDEPDLVVVEARVEGNLVRVVDVDRAVHPVDRRHVLAPHGAVDARKQRVAHAVAVYRAHVDGVLRRGRDGDEGGPALPHEHLQGGVDIFDRAKRARRLEQNEDVVASPQQEKLVTRMHDSVNGPRRVRGELGRRLLRDGRELGIPERVLRAVRGIAGENREDVGTSALPRRRGIRACRRIMRLVMADNPIGRKAA